jgi:cytochrome c-type biogenesis protein CcmF
VPELGRAALVVALGLAVYATVAGAVAARRRRRRLAHSAQNALFAAFGATAVAAAVLAAALVRRDLSFVYVAQHISRDLPLPYGRRAGEDVVAWAVPVLGGLATFFALLVVAVQSPFATQAAPPEGAGMTPSLQNPYMMAHPPMLYLGYVGLAIPWTFAMGALLARRADERWIIATRRWTLLAWAFLGVGQLLGAKWAYEEVGWGGYYAWDPVENAALMPWLAATAYLHSVMIQEKRGMLRVWNVVLVTLAFGLSLFGTFLTRSGVVNSIHSFAQGPIGAWFVAFIALVVGFSLYLIFTRLPLLRSRTRLESLVSREATFLYNNLLLVAFCLTILWGVLFPIVSEAVRGEQRTIGPGYYNFFLKSFGLPLLLLMGIGPLIAWRRASLRALGRTFLWPLGAALAVGLVLLALGAGSSPLGLIAYTFSAFVLASIVLEFARGTRARRALGAPGWGSAFAQLVANNRRRYGGYIVHAAVVLLVIGVVGSSLFQTVREQSLRPGQTMTAGDYTLAYRTLERRQAANAEEERAVLAVSRGGRDLGTVRAGKNLYPVEQQASNEVAIRSDPLTGEDLFVIADEIDADGTVYFKVFVKPLVNLVWLAGLVFIVGAVVAMWPDSREARRLATRTARPPAPARA